MTLIEGPGASTEWETPPEFFRRLDNIYHFELDAAASYDNAKCGRYYTKAEDGLIKPWARSTWLNPPYGSGIPNWLSKAYDEWLMGNQSVILLPARTDTVWWHQYAMLANNIIFIRGRIRFLEDGVAMPNPKFPSVLVIYGYLQPWGKVRGPVITSMSASAFDPLGGHQDC